MTQPPRRHRLRLLPVVAGSPVVVAGVWALGRAGADCGQQGPPARMRREIKGIGFRKGGVGGRPARGGRAVRGGLLARGSFGALNPPMAAVGAPLASATSV